MTAANVEVALHGMTAMLTSNNGRLLGDQADRLCCADPRPISSARALIEAQMINATSNTLYKLVELVNVPWLA